jgi:hypothetical protein
VDPAEGEAEPEGGSDLAAEVVAGARAPVGVAALTAAAVYGKPAKAPVAEVREAEVQEAEGLEPVAQVAVQGLAGEELALAVDPDSVAAAVVELVRAVEAGLAMVAVAEPALALAVDLAAEEVEAE